MCIYERTGLGLFSQLVHRWKLLRKIILRARNLRVAQGWSKWIEVSTCIRVQPVVADCRPYSRPYSPNHPQWALFVRGRLRPARCVCSYLGLGGRRRPRCTPELHFQLRLEWLRADLDSAMAADGESEEDDARGDNEEGLGPYLSPEQLVRNRRLGRVISASSPMAASSLTPWTTNSTFNGVRRSELRMVRARLWGSPNRRRALHSPDTPALVTTPTQSRERRATGPQSPSRSPGHSAGRSTTRPWAASDTSLSWR